MNKFLVLFEIFLKGFRITLEKQYIGDVMIIKMRLDELFEETGLKKKAAAKYVGVDATTMSNWIHGRSYPKLDQAVLLAVFFNKEITDLYEWVENK